MEITNYGYSVVASDLKRLKRYRSLKNDLNSFFNRFRETFLLYNNTSDDRVYFDANGIVGFEGKISIMSHNLSKQHGCRLWYLLIPNQTDRIFLPALVFDCREEKSYPKRICLDIIKKRLEEYFNSSS